MSQASSPEVFRFSLSELAESLEPVFVKAGASRDVARVLAFNCASAERDGSRSHGLFRVRGYVENLRSGFVNGRAQPRIERPGAAFLRVDADRGYARPALELVQDEAMRMAGTAGVCVIAIGNAHHNGPLWLDAEPFAEQGFVALTMVNSVKYVVPHGGHAAVYGTNPMAFAVPRADGSVMVFDQATAAMANGEVRIAAREGRTLPQGVGVDAGGQPTCDPNAVLNGGALLPFGGHKGSQIAMMIDLLAGALTGSNFSHQVDWSAYPGAESAHTGQFFILVDPAKGCVERGAFAGRVEELVAALRDAGQSRFPGDTRLRARQSALSEGIPVDASTWAELKALGAKG